MSSIVVVIVFLSCVIIQIIHASNLRCYDDYGGSFRLVEHCRACVIYIDIKMNTGISQRKQFDHDQKQSASQQTSNTIVHQRCAREFDGPLYGFDQTRCYCNTNLCNSNIQRCFYEIVSRRYFSCYQGSNASQNSLEINKKCRSCRIRKESSLTYHYECLTFGEQEQRSHTQCTCQHPMCNQDFAICQRFQQIPSQARVNVISQIVRNTTKTFSIITTITTTSTTTTTTTSLLTTSVKSLITVSTINQTELETFANNITTIELTSIYTNETNTVRLESKNHAHSFSAHYLLYFTSFLLM